MHLVAPDDPILWTPAAPVEDISSQVLPHIAAMGVLMLEKGGAGLAAPQVGIPLAFFLWGNRHRISAVINPYLVSRSSDEEMGEEGCLSLPGFTAQVSRPITISLSWRDERQILMHRTFMGPAARVALHEMDHLNARLIFPRPIALDKSPQNS